MARQGYYGAGGVWVPGDEGTGLGPGQMGGNPAAGSNPNYQPEFQGTGLHDPNTLFALLQWGKKEEERKAAIERIAGPQRRWYETFLQQRLNAPGRFYSSLIQAGPQRPGISGPKRESISSQNINNLAATLNVPNLRPVMGGD